MLKGYAVGLLYSGFYPYTLIKGLEGNSEEIYFYDVPFSKLEQQVYLDIREIVGL